MNDQPDRESTGRQELLDLAASMLRGDVDLIEGVRRICALRAAMQDPDNEVFLTFRAVESDTDAFPRGKMRLSCSDEYLRRADREMECYLADARDDILQACRQIITAFR